MSRVDRILLALAIAGSLACFAGRQQWAVPVSNQEGVACVQRCQSLKYQCESARGGANRSAADMISCRNEYETCKSGCPGAFLQDR